MNTKLFWENVNKRMKYERAQRLQRRRKAGVKRASKSSQIDNEKQLQIECLLQVLEEYVTASLSQKDESYDNDRLSEDIDIISIAVQKLKKDMVADVLLSTGISGEKDDTYDTVSPGVQLAMKALDDLAEDKIINENGKEQELDEDKENSGNLTGAKRAENPGKNSSGADISSARNKRHFDDENKTDALLASTKCVSDMTHDESKRKESPQLLSADINAATEITSGVAENEGNAEVGGFQDDFGGSRGELRRTLEGDSGNEDEDIVEKDGKISVAAEETVEVAQRNDVTHVLAAKSACTRSTSDLTNVATMIDSVESNSVVPPDSLSPLESSEARQNKDSLRFLKKTKFAINRKKTEKSSVWSRKLISRSQQQQISQLEEDMRKEKPKFNMKGDKVLQKAISSLKKNLRQQPAGEGPNPEPLPPKLLNAAHFQNWAEK